MPYDPLILNVGVGGSTLATDTFTDTDSTTKTMPYGAVAFGPLNGPYVVVTSTVGLPVAVVGSVSVTGTFFQATQPVSIAGTVTVSGPLTDAQLRATALPVSGTVAFSNTTLAVTNAGTFATQAAQSGAWNITNVSGTVSLPTGASTSALQTTGNASVASLDTKAPALGQALAAASVPVVLPATQITTLTPPAAITGFALEAGHLATIDTSTARIPAQGQALAAASLPVVLTAAQIATLTPLTSVAVTNAGTFAVQATLAAETTKVIGTVNQGTSPWVCSVASTTITGSVAVTGTFWQATQPVSLTSTTITGSVAVTQSGTWSLAANQSVNTAQINGITPLMGNGATGTGSQRVTLSSDQVSTAAILTDALANPTLGQQAVLSSLFNGTTWDRQRGMSTNNATGDTGAKTATGSGVAIANVGNKGVSIVLNLGTVLGTTPTFVLKVQGSADNGTTWYDIPGATTATITSTGVFGITIYPGAPTVAGTATSISGTASCGQPLPRMWRVVWTIGGTTPSYTITNIQYNYLPN